MSKGYVYILTNEAMPGLIKVGKTTRTVQNRVDELWQTGVPLPFREAESFYVPDCDALESEFHTSFADDRVSQSREFFRTDVGCAASALAGLAKCQLREFVSEFDECVSLVDETLCVDEATIILLAAGLGVEPHDVPGIIECLEPDDMEAAKARWEQVKEARLRRLSEGLGPGSLKPEDIDREIAERETYSEAAVVSILGNRNG